MIKTAGTIFLIILALAIVAGLATAGRTSAGASMASSGSGDTKTFTLGDHAFTIKMISPADASRLEETGVLTASMPAKKNVLVTYFASAKPRNQAKLERGPPNMIVFGPDGFSSVVTYTGALPDEPMPTYSLSGRTGQVYLITPESGDATDGVLVTFQ